MASGAAAPAPSYCRCRPPAGRTAPPPHRPAQSETSRVRWSSAEPHFFLLAAEEILERARHLLHKLARVPGFVLTLIFRCGFGPDFGSIGRFVSFEVLQEDGRVLGISSPDLFKAIPVQRGQREHMRPRRGRV